MTQVEEPPLAVVETVGRVTVVRLTRAVTLTGADAEEFAELLSRLTDQTYRLRVVINLANASLLSSYMLGKLVSLRKKVMAGSGRLVLSNLNPSLRELLDAINLSRILAIYEDEARALESFDLQK